MGRKLLFIVLCAGIIFSGIDVFKPIEKNDVTNIPKQKVKIQKRVADDEVQEEVVVSQKPVLIYFYTTWCRGCKSFSPYWDKLVSEYDDKFTCIKINIDDAKYRKIVNEFGIRKIPQVYVYDRESKRKVNLRPSTYMNSQLDDYYKKYCKK